MSPSIFDLNLDEPSINDFSAEPVLSLCRRRRASLIKWMRRNSIIVNLLNAGPESFDAKEFASVMLETMKRVAREFYCVAKYGVPFQTLEEFTEHEAMIKARYPGEEPYFRLDNFTGYERVHAWRQINEELTEFLVFDLNISEVSGLSIDAADFETYDYKNIMDRIIEQHQPEYSVVWNMLFSFLNREATGTSLTANLTATGEAVTNLRRYFAKNPTALDSFLFASSYLQVMYRDVFPYANKHLEPEIRGVINHMLVTKAVINEETLREAFSKTSIPDLAEEGPISRSYDYQKPTMPFRLRPSKQHN